MDFEEHLTKYLDKETIDLLLESLKDNRTNSLVINENKISSTFFKNEFPNIIEHPFLKNVFYYNKDEYQFGKNYLFDNGAYYIMDSSSMLVSEFLPIKENDIILDMCAAPGGKSIYLSLKNKNICLLSNDSSYERCLKMSSNIEKLGLDNIIITNYNFIEDDSNFFDNKFDKIILDAPCSGSAMFRKNEESKKDWTLKKVSSLSLIQSKLIEKAYSMLKKDGYLIYSTCSFSYEENEGIILNFLSKHQNAKIIELPNNSTFYRSNDLKEAIHLFPCFYKGEGQFIALIQKNEGEVSHFKEKKDTFKIKEELIKEYNLPFRYFYKINDKIYGSNYNINIGRLNLIRYGINVFDIKNDKIFVPTFNLSHFLNDKNIDLTFDEFKNYIKGLEINKKLNLKNGYYIVNYNNLNLGYVKYNNGILKNLYPKGLRH